MAVIENPKRDVDQEEKKVFYDYLVQVQDVDSFIDFKQDNILPIL